MEFGPCCHAGWCRLRDQVNISPAPCQLKLIFVNHLNNPFWLFWYNCDSKFNKLQDWIAINIGVLPSWFLALRFAPLLINISAALIPKFGHLISMNQIILNKPQNWTKININHHYRVVNVMPSQIDDFYG